MDERPDDPIDDDAPTRSTERWPEFGRAVRWLTGVPEELLSDVPYERPRYNGLAWAMLGTAGLATVGMTLLVSQVSDLSWGLVALAGIAWGGFILGIDYFIVSYLDSEKALQSAREVADEPVKKSSRRRTRGVFGRGVVRILLAIFLGLTVGESLVIASFGSAATNKLDGEREKVLLARYCAELRVLISFRPDVPTVKDCSSSPPGAPADPASSEVPTDSAVPAPSTAATTSASETSSGAPPVTIPPVDKSLYDTTALEKRRTELDDLVNLYTRSAACEAQPKNFPPEERAKLLCSGSGGFGPIYDGLIADEKKYKDERDSVDAQIADKESQLAAAVTSYNDAAAALAQQQSQAAIDANAAETQSQSAIDEATATATANSVEAQAEAARQAKDRADTRYNSQDAVDSSARLAERRTELDDLQSGKARPVYGLSERFVATEDAVDWRIRWALRLLFVFVDMTPILLKLTMGVSTVDQMVAIRRRIAIYPFLQELRDVEAAFKDGQDVRPLLPVAGTERRRGRVSHLADLVVSGLSARLRRSPRQDAVSADDIPEAPRGRTSTEADPSPDPVSGRTYESDPKNLLFVDGIQYVRMEQIGSGNFANLVRVKPNNPDDFDTSFPLVAKIPKRGSASRGQLQRENEIYRRLRTNTGVADLVRGDRNALVLRYYPRTSIDRYYFGERSSAHRFSLADWIEWLHSLQDMLAALWQLGYAHGDGKPANILLTGDTGSADAGPSLHEPNRAVVIDFGSAGLFGTKPTTESFGYAPPEIALRRNRAPLSPLTDLYSMLGATSYYLLSGGVHPWLDQVLEQPGKSAARRIPAGGDLSAFRRQWRTAMQTQELTPLRELQPIIPPAVEAQIATWMSSEPTARLRLSGATEQEWELGRWETDLISSRVRDQIRSLTRALRESPSGDQDRPLFGDLNARAIPPDDFPDSTVDIEEPGTDRGGLDDKEDL